MHRLVLALGMSAPFFGVGTRRSLLGIRDLSPSTPLHNAPDHDAPDHHDAPDVAPDHDAPNSGAPDPSELMNDPMWLVSGGRDGVPANLKGEDPSLSILEEAQDTCSAWGDRSTDHFGLAANAAGVAGAGAGELSGAAKSMEKLAVFSAKFSWASGALGMAGPGIAIAGELFFDDPNKLRIDRLEKAVDCIGSIVGELVEKVAALEGRMDAVEAQIKKEKRERLLSSVKDALDHMNHFVNTTAKKFTPVRTRWGSINDCLTENAWKKSRDLATHSVGLLYDDCLAENLAPLVTNFHIDGSNDWAQFVKKSKDLVNNRLEGVPRERQKFYIKALLLAATAGLNAAQMAYNKVNAWALNICKWRYKYYKNTSIPLEENYLCVYAPPGDEDANARNLKEIVLNARAHVIGMATEADWFYEHFLSWCRQTYSVFDLVPGTRRRGDRKAGEKNWCQNYPDHPVSAADQIERGCCFLSPPFDVGPYWEEGWQKLRYPMQFPPNRPEFPMQGRSDLKAGVDEDNYLWKLYVQPLHANLVPPWPAELLTLQPKRYTWGYSGWQPPY